jgi:DNA-binding transcriptional LysR family regulator
MTFAGPDAVKRAVMAGLGVSMVSKLTVRDELSSGTLIDLGVASPMLRRRSCVVDHPQKHHGAACRAMLALFERVLDLAVTPGVVTRRPRRRVARR